MRMLNLGILAHVDAGKTTLTERLLFAAGVIDEIGSVDAGTTRTDSLALERRRGITIKSAVASFAVGGIVVNLIDTPGHPDFIAEVERVLSVLDGAILVISAVEGVQPQTRVLMRALQRLRIPVLFFVNKIDRVGADAERVLAEIARRLSPAIVPMGFTRAADRARLRVALGQLAEQDPLINVRQDDALGELSVSLYGEVQKEVIQATLADDFGVDVTFRETTTIHVERLAGRGAAAEFLHGGTNPFLATLGLRVDPAPAGAGLTVRLDVDVRMVPMYIYKTTDVFTEMMTQYVRHTLREGLAGWQVPDCAVTVTDCGYVSPSTTAADFRKLTPLVLMAALKQAGTVVCEPMIRVSLEIPADTTGIVLTAVARLGGVATTPSPHGDLAEVAAVLPAARAQALQRQLPGLTSGEGVIETTFGGYRPVRGTPPTRPRTMADPFNREEYLRRAARHTPALRCGPDRPRRAVHPAPRCGPDRPRRAVPRPHGAGCLSGALIHQVQALTSGQRAHGPVRARHSRPKGPSARVPYPIRAPVPVTQCDIRVVITTPMSHRVKSNPAAWDSRYESES